MKGTTLGSRAMFRGEPANSGGSVSLDGMKFVSVAVMVLGACYTETKAPPVANTCPAPELNCKETIETSQALVGKRGQDVTLAIGECEQDGWSVALRKCVASAHSLADVDQCASHYKVARHSVFADRASMAEAVAAMTEFKAKMCACQDAKCAELVSNEMTKWGEEQAKDTREPAKMSEEETKAFVQIGEDMGKCMQRAMGGGTP
jgi:hypothetical protein